jgi:hypothetical protein
MIFDAGVGSRQAHFLFKGVILPRDAMRYATVLNFECSIIWCFHQSNFPDLYLGRVITSRRIGPVNFSLLFDNLTLTVLPRPSVPYLTVGIYSADIGMMKILLAWS